MGLRPDSRRKLLSCEDPLSFLDLNKPVFKFSFEEEYPYSDRPLIGIAYKKDEKKVKTIRGVYCDKILPNSGSFSDTYDALHNGVKLVDGKHGKAGRFTEKSVMSSFAMGPLEKGKPVSIAAWVKTTSSADQVIVNNRVYHQTSLWLCAYYTLLF